ncbi:MAG: phage holin family protein [Solirubrobacterales bacterium]
MSLLRDLVVTVGDALRLSSDVMRRNIEVQSKAIKRGIGRIVASVALAMAAACMAAIGSGFLLYAIFVYIARETGFPAAGLIVGVGLLLLAIAVFLVGRSIGTRS